MNQRKAKAIKRKMRQQRGKIGEAIVENTMKLPLKTRASVAWKILKGKL